MTAAVNAHILNTVSECFRPQLLQYPLGRNLALRPCSLFFSTLFYGEHAAYLICPPPSIPTLSSLWTNIKKTVFLSIQVTEYISVLASPSIQECSYHSLRNCQQAEGYLKHLNSPWIHANSHIYMSLSSSCCILTSLDSLTLTFSMPLYN